MVALMNVGALDQRYLQIHPFCGGAFSVTEYVCRGRSWGRGSHRNSQASLPAAKAYLNSSMIIRRHSWVLFLTSQGNTYILLVLTALAMRILRFRCLSKLKYGEYKLKPEFSYQKCRGPCIYLVASGIHCKYKYLSHTTCYAWFVIRIDFYLFFWLTLMASFCFSDLTVSVTWGTSHLSRCDCSSAPEPDEINFSAVGMHRLALTWHSLPVLIAKEWRPGEMKVHP